ncbi:MAG: hemerythrin domain-containing protein [Gemmatimonadota bacterium]|nr:hemerythrin domain-containing protein [Gemmatimonadota bacterium]
MTKAEAAEPDRAMLLTMGRKHHGGGDLVDMLLECHVRIRTFSSLAIAVGEHADAPVAEVADACARVERMHEQHETHVELLQRLLAFSAARRAQPGDATARAALLGVARPVQSVFEPHLQAEEEILFPAIRALVSSEEQVAMVGELRARRRPAEAAPSLP